MITSVPPRGALKFYVVEDELFAYAEHIKLTEKAAEKITRKLCRHFKFPNPTQIRWWGIEGKNSGCANFVRYDIRLPRGSSVNMLLHELAHLYLSFRKPFMVRHHCKKMLTVLKRFHRYCEKKLYWGLTEVDMK